AAGGVLTVKQAPTGPALGLRAGGVVLPTVSQAETTRKTKNVIRILASRSVPARRNASPQIPASRGTAKIPPPKPGAAGGPRRADRRLPGPQLWPRSGTAGKSCFRLHWP